MLLAWLMDSGGLGDLPASWPTLGAGGILGLGVIALITGRGLATRREVDEANKRTEEANRRADKWEQVALEALGQNRQLLATSQVTERVISSLPKALQRREPDDQEPA
jgi:hypothetical protein